MINVSSAVKQAYKNGNASTDIFLTIGNTEYDPTNILAGSVSITESFCSASQFDISRVEKNSLSFTLFNITENISDLQGETVVARQEITLAGESTPTVIPLGTYTIVSAVNDGDNLYKCECFDSTMLAFDTIVDDWWNTTLTFPITLRNLAVALFTHLGITSNVPQTFTNYDYTITARPVFFQGVTAAELLGYIQEVAGGFFKADRNGTMQFYTIQTVSQQDTSIIISNGYAGKEEYTYRQIVGDLYIADYEVEPIDKLQVRGTEDDIGIIVGTGDNAYIITGNVLMYTLTDTTGSTVVTNIYNAIKDMTYIPFSARLMALPYVEVGDCVSLTTLKNKNATAPVLQRVLSGSKLAFDNFAANGEEEREEVPAVNRELKTLNQKTHEIVNTVEEFSSTITDIETDISGLDTRVTNNTSAIQQNAQDITLKVSQTDYTGSNIISLINLDTSGATIQASHVVIDTSSLDLTFGSQASHVTIEATENNDGVLFDGTGKVQFETNGEFYAKNLDSSDHIANSMQLAVGSSANTLYLRNRYNDLAANILSFSSTATNHSIWYYNYQIGQTTANSNNMVLETASSYYRSNIHNFNFETVNSTTNSGVLANRVSLYSTATYNQLTLDNDNLGDTAGNAKYANRMFMYHDKSSYSNNIGINNYRQGTDNKYANYIYLNANSSSYTASIYNYNYEYLNSNNDGTIANSLLLSSNSTTNYLGVYNRNQSGSLTNSFTLTHDSTNNQIQFYNRMSSNVSYIANEIQLEGNTSGYVSYLVKNYDRTNYKVANMIFMSSRPYANTINGAVIPANNSLNLVNYQNNANEIVNSKITMNDNITLECQNRAGFNFIGNGKQFSVKNADNGIVLATEDFSDSLFEAKKIYLLAWNGVYIVDSNNPTGKRL